MNGSAGREDPLDRVLRATPLAGVPPTADACLDAETLAAIVDGDLRGPARATAEQHAAGCERCQAALAALVRITPEPSRSAWWSIDRLPWAVPVAATAAAAAIWLAVIRAPVRDLRTVTPPALPAPSAANGVARAEPTPERREVAKQVAPPVPSSDRARADLADAKTNTAEAKAITAEPKAKLRDKDAAGRLQKAETDALARKEDASPSADAPPAQAPLTAAAPPPAPPPAVTGQAAAKPAAPMAGGSRQEYAAAGAPRADAAAADRGERQPLPALESIIITSEILSPDPRIRWRLAGQTVQRSTDGGATWVAQSTGTTTRLNAGASPSPVLCWVVGDDGLVLMTADGLTWQRATNPASDPLVAVTATDADHAIVTTRDGRAFVTADRGRTWTRRPTP